MRRNSDLRISESNMQGLVNEVFIKMFRIILTSNEFLYRYTR